MSLKELVDVVTAKTELPDDQVRKASLVILEKNC